MGAEASTGYDPQHESEGIVSTAAIERRRQIQKDFYYRHRKRMIAKTTANTKARRMKHPEKYQEFLRKQKDTRRKRLYGLTPEQWWGIFEGQNLACNICKSETTAGRGWHTDHCHSTNKVRGILCYHCNLLLGMAKDSIDTLEKAIAYLKNSVQNQEKG